MITLHPTRTRRGGFTLVELLVAAALTVLVMAILATAFQRGMSTFSHLKSVVTLSEQLRSAEAVIRRDLEATHLEKETGEPVRVSDPAVSFGEWLSPNRGFFEIVNFNNATSTEFVAEGSEEGLASQRVTGHSLAFTAKLSAANTDSIFYGDTASFVNWTGLADLSPGGGKSVSPWAELYYFLTPQPGNPNTPDVLNDDGTVNSKGVPLFTLCRRQALPAPGARDLTNTATPPNSFPAGSLRAASLPDLSYSTYPFYTQAGPVPPPPPPTGRDLVNDTATLTDWRNRMRFQWPSNPSTFGPPLATVGVTDVQRLTIPPVTVATKPYRCWVMPTISLPDDKIGTEFLLPNVISFQVRPQFGTSASTAHFDELPVVTGGNPSNANYPRLWDTGTGTNPKRIDPNLPYRDPQVQVLRGVQLKLRIWDTKNKMTRQMTISVDL